MGAQKKAPGKAASQGGKGHYTFPGAIGLVRDRSRRLGMARAVGLPLGSNRRAREGVHARAGSLRGPQERSVERPQMQARSTWIRCGFSYPPKFPPAASCCTQEVGRIGISQKCVNGKKPRPWLHFFGPPAGSS